MATLELMPVAESSRADSRARRGERFTAVMAAIVRGLPFGLARIVAPSMLGFAVINSCTFAVDLALLTAFHGALRWPVPVSITLGYLTASGLSYLLNRSLNFRSHGAVAPQAGVFAGVAIVNYLAWVLGVGAGLAALGVDYRLARIAAGACEAVYMYAAMRWLVFRDVQARGAQQFSGARRQAARHRSGPAPRAPAGAAGCPAGSPPRPTDQTGPSPGPGGPRPA
jgi:putative flippase GtrA